MGIILGLYFIESIVFFLFINIVVLLTVIIIVNKNQNNKKIRKNIIILIIAILISSFYIGTIEKNKLENKSTLNNLLDKEVDIYGEVISNLKEGEYKNTFQIAVEKIIVNNREQIYLKNKNIKLFVYISKKESKEFFVGDYIKVFGKYEDISSYNNFDTFNYKEQMERKSLYGSIDISNISVIEKRKNKINYIRYSIINFIIERVKNNIKNHPGILIGILIGNTDLIEDDVVENFNKSNISHVLAVSGTHISFIIIFVGAILNKFFKTYKIKKIILIIILLLFLYIIGFTPSVARAVIMGIILLLSKIIYRKSNIYNNLLISGLIILLISPYYIYDLGFLLSYLTTMRNNYVF